MSLGTFLQSSYVIGTFSLTIHEHWLLKSDDDDDSWLQGLSFQPYLVYQMHFLLANLMPPVLAPLQV
jgi:hypothetical protein